MGIGNPEDEALNRILGDMDGMESNKMFGDKGGNAKGVSITISVTPNGEEGEGEPDADDYPEGHDIGMCKGGCAYHKGGAVGMADGGAVLGQGLPNSQDGNKKSEEELAKMQAASLGESDGEDKTLPPFLRKKKKS